MVLPQVRQQEERQKAQEEEAPGSLTTPIYLGKLENLSCTPGKYPGKLPWGPPGADWRDLLRGGDPRLPFDSLFSLQGLVWKVSGEDKAETTLTVI